jgi:predicted CoA-binding protein
MAAAARTAATDAAATHAAPAQRPGSSQHPDQNHAQILRILRGYKRIAMVGLSNNPNRPSYFAATYLKDYGYEIIPVNPTYPEVMGFKAYSNLDAVVKAGIALEVVDIFRKPVEVPAIVDDAIRLGAKVIWMQLGVIHEGARDTAKAAGLDVVMDRCMKIEHARFHGGLNFAGIRTNLVTARKPRLNELP